MFTNGDTMVTKTKRPATVAPSKRPAASKRARVTSVDDATRASVIAHDAEPQPATVTEAAKPNLLRAGLKALGNVGNDVVQHQSRVFEAILGIDPSQAWSGLLKRDGVGAKPAQDAATAMAAEPVGLRKFEAVFDQRVASALERIGMPSLKAVKALEREVASMGREVAALREEVAALKSELGTTPQRPSAKPARRKS
jgi:hypothetical protein